jgi:hypothetical protein
MRLLALLVLTGCSSTVDLDLRTVLPTAARGVAVHDGGQVADVAMADQVCQIHIPSGAVVGDINPSEGAERLVDAAGAATLALGDGLFTLGDGAADAVPLTITPIDGRFATQGVVGLFATDDAACGLARWDGASATGQAIPGTDCSGEVGFDLDPAEGVAWVADGATLTATAASGEVVVYDVATDGIDAVAWDGAAGVAVVYARGGDELTAFSPKHGVTWATRVAGRLQSVAVADAEGVVVASVATDHGGQILVIDGHTGAALAEHAVPDVPEVAISPDGTGLALQTPDAVYFYTVDPHASPLDTPSTAQSEGATGLSGGTSMLGALLAAAIVVAVE